MVRSIDPGRTTPRATYAHSDDGIVQMHAKHTRPTDTSPRAARSTSSLHVQRSHHQSLRSRSPTFTAAPKPRCSSSSAKAAHLQGDFSSDEKPPDKWDGSHLIAIAPSAPCERSRLQRWATRGSRHEVSRPASKSG